MEAVWIITATKFVDIWNALVCRHNFQYFRRRKRLWSAYNSIPASVLGRVVVYRFICENTWNRHLWCFAWGHVLRSALLKPEPPSDTTITGSAILDLNAFQAPECSYLHRYHPSTYSSSQQINIHAFLARYMPSKYTTSFLSSMTGGIGHRFQNFAVFLRNILPPTWHIPLSASSKQPLQKHI